MAPLICIVRHGEGENNINNSYWVQDAVLTPNGKSQCLSLRERFPYHERASIVMSSPLRRAVQTASLAFAPVIARPEVQYLVVPEGQEANDLPCDIGHPRQELESQLSGLIGADNVGFSLDKIDLSRVEEGWNSKIGKWAADREAVKKRAASLRSWLHQRPEEFILFVTHGAFIHYLTEDWSGDDPVRGTGYLNCEYRIFQFTEDSTAENPHLEETLESRTNRLGRN